MEEVLKEMAEIANEPVILNTDVITLMAVIGNIQLGLRHPQNTVPSSVMAREFVEQVKTRLSEINPVLEIVVDAGWR